MPASWSEEERRLLEQLRAKRTDHPRQEWLRSAAL